MQQQKTSDELWQVRFAIVEKYLASGLNQKEFSQQENLPYSTFKYWLKRYRQANGAPITEGKPGGNFVPLSFSAPPTQADYIIEYPSGVVLRIRRPIEPQALIQLILASEV